MIYFAKRLSEEKLYKNVDLIGFGAQEDWYATLKDNFDGWSKRRLRKKMKRLGYLIGSRHFVLSKGVKNIDSVIAIDAVAIGTPKIVSGDSFVKSTLSTDFFKDLESIKIGGFRIKPGKRSAVGIGCDHLPFLVAGVPSTWIIASRGTPTEKNIFGYILNHDNIPNYCTAGDTYNNLIKETSNEEIIRNFKLLSDSLIQYIGKRKL